MNLSLKMKSNNILERVTAKRIFAQQEQSRAGIVISTQKFSTETIHACEAQRWAFQQIEECNIILSTLT